MAIEDPKGDPFMQALSAEDELGRTVRCHIHIENLLEQFVRLAIPDADEVLASLEYEQKVLLAIAVGLPKELKAALNATGNLRNKFAHRLDQRITQATADNFYKVLPSSTKAMLQRGYAKQRATKSGVPELKNQKPDRQLTIHLLYLYHYTRMLVEQKATDIK